MSPNTSSSSSRRRKTASTSNVMFTNAVYFPNFKIYNGATPGMMNYSCVNHVYYAFANVAADGSVFVSRLFAPELHIPRFQLAGSGMLIFESS